MKSTLIVRCKFATALTAFLSVFFTSMHIAPAQLWTALAPDGPPMADYHDTWHAVAISPDGTKLAVGGGTDDERCPLCQSIPPPVNSIYVSTNGGATWTGGPIDAWQAIAASADWTKLVAVSWQLIFSPFGFVTPSGKIYTSTNSGVTWTANTNFAANVWSSVASSADGTRLVAAAGFSLGSWLLGDGSIYVTTDSGSTWVRTGAPTNDWTSVASSADGTKLVAAADTNSFGDGLLYLSHDAGATWAPANLPTNNWTSVASSADGTHLVATGWGQGGGVIYRSADSGASWTLTGAPSDQYWSSVASSADGTTLLAGGNFIYMSRDSGSTWTLTGAPPDYAWSTVALSADGSRAVAGGWSNLCTLPYSGTWRMADLPANSWFSIASSADGSRVVAAAGYPSVNQIQQSTNWGAAWTVTSVPDSGPLASSADGSKLFTAAGEIYASQDSGATWPPILATNLYWTSIASSGDGSVLIAASYGLYIFTNGGASWSRPNSAGVTNNQFTGVASSADGAKLVAVAAGPALSVYGGDGYIYTSSDSGKTWNWADAPQNGWTCVASSADGVKLVAGSSVYTDTTSGDGFLYTSANSGVLWKRTRAPSNGWSSVACSADGTRIVAVTYVGDAIYLSSDSGVTWVSANPPAGTWTAVTCSADGGAIVAAGNELICTLRLPAATLPRLSIGPSGASLGLSWPVPSTTFVVQQNLDLASTNWADLLMTPTLNFANLDFQLTLPRAQGAAFYRLKQQ